MPRQDWDKHIVGSLTVRKYKVHEVLADWFEAIGNGTVTNRLPDPASYSFTEEQLEGLVNEIDNYVFAQRHWVKIQPDRDGFMAEHAPGFITLLPAQRLAFAQDLKRVLEKYPKPYEQVPVNEEFFSD